MDAPPRLLRKQAETLFSDPVERERFVRSLMKPGAREQALVILRDDPRLREIPKLPPVKWQPEFVRRVPDEFRAGKHPLHDEGVYYVLDFSSVFAAFPLTLIAGFDGAGDTSRQLPSPPTPSPFSEERGGSSETPSLGLEQPSHRNSSSFREERGGLDAARPSFESELPSPPTPSPFSEGRGGLGEAPSLELEQSSDSNPSSFREGRGGYRVLDLCAAPGGKSILAWRTLKPELLVANETIRKRTGALIENLSRCRIEGSCVWSADPSVWADRFPEAFDLAIVDAPCTGQSLLAKGQEAPGCFSPQLIDMNVGRQRRIVANAAKCIRPGGWMLYSTCTFSRKENEKVIEWLLEQFEYFEAVEVPALKEFRSAHSKVPCYRLFPHQGLGAGAFTCLLRRGGEPPAHRSAIDVPCSWRYGAAVSDTERSPA